MRNPVRTSKRTFTRTVVDLDAVRYRHLMRSVEEFSGFEVAEIEQPIWRAGGPNSKASAHSAEVGVPSLALTAGAPYEVEGAMAGSPDRARALAVVQDLARVSLQLTPPIQPELLYERRPPLIRCLRLVGVPVLHATGEEAESRLGLERNPSADSLMDQAEPWRKAVRGLRGDGWPGAIALPGFDSDAEILLVPRSFLMRGQVRVADWNGGLKESVPPPLIDFALGLERDFPAAAEVGALPLIRQPRRRATRSWRPSSSRVG